MRVLLLCVLTAWLAIPVLAQAPVEPPSAPARASLDAVDLRLLQSVVSASKLAQTTCATLDEMKLYTELRAAVEQMIHAKHQGFTLDWATGTLRPTPSAVSGGSR